MNTERRINVRVSDQFFKDVKGKAGKNGLTLQSLLVAYLEEWLEDDADPKSTPSLRPDKKVTQIPETKLQRELANQVSFILAHGSDEDIRSLKSVLNIVRGSVEKTRSVETSSDSGGTNNTGNEDNGHTEGLDHRGEPPRRRRGR